MKTRIPLILSLIGLGMFLVLPASLGRAQGTPGTPAESKPAAEAKPQSVYRLEFVVRELDGGKAINSRSYSMSAQDGDWGRLRVGSRVAYKNAENSFQYENVGINIDCRVKELESRLLLSTTFEATSFASASDTMGASVSPVRRQVNLSEQSLVTPGTPTVIGKLDDVVTNHRFEIEVTATKVK